MNGGVKIYVVFKQEKIMFMQKHYKLILPSMKRLATEDLTFLRICKEDLGNA